MTALVRTATLTNYNEVARHLGLNPTPLLRRVGLNRALLSDPDQRVPARSVAQLLEESALESGCESFGLRMAESRQLSDFGAISLLLTHQRTLRDALRILVDYRHLLNESLALVVEDAGPSVILREELTTDSEGPYRQATELAIGVLFRFCRTLLGGGCAAWRSQTRNSS